MAALADASMVVVAAGPARSQGAIEIQRLYQATIPALQAVEAAPVRVKVQGNEVVVLASTNGTVVAGCRRHRALSKGLDFDLACNPDNDGGALLERYALSDWNLCANGAVHLEVGPTDEVIVQPGKDGVLYTSRA